MARVTQGCSDGLPFLHTRASASDWISAQNRISASGCRPSTGRIDFCPDHPDVRSDPSAGCRFGATRAARYRSHTVRQHRSPCYGAVASLTGFPPPMQGLQVAPTRDRDYPRVQYRYLAPAMLVAMVTEPGAPAWAMMSASRWCCLAFSTS